MTDRRDTLGPRPTDDVRRAEIARIRRWATALLGAAAVVYVTAHFLEQRWWWMGFIRATAEASLVGGLADWFAVTALFRQPLGLPIPHTAIVKTQKARIARVLGHFVQTHFLTREVIAQRMHALALAERIGGWLADPANAQRLAGQVTQGVAAAVERLPVDGWQSGLVDEGVRLIANAVESDDEAIALIIREQIAGALPRWTPNIVQDAVLKRVRGSLHHFVTEVASNREHPTRLRLEHTLRGALDRWRASAERPALPSGATSATDASVDAAASAEAGMPSDGGAPSALARAIAAVGEHLVKDESARAEFEARLTEIASSFVEEHGDEVAALIEHTVAGWDPDRAAERIELAVGRDLQYIRLNGTLVGGLAGLVLYSLSLLFG